MYLMMAVAESNAERGGGKAKKKAPSAKEIHTKRAKKQIIKRENIADESDDFEQ